MSGKCRECGRPLVIIGLNSYEDGIEVQCRKCGEWRTAKVSMLLVKGRVWARNGG